MTKTTYTMEDTSQTNHSELPVEDQILHLKRLLVTLKQQYEKKLQIVNEQLQKEVRQPQGVHKEAERFKIELEEVKKSHEEELQSLKQQQLTLKEILKKSQEETKQLRVQISSQIEQTELLESQQRVEQLERVIPYLRERTEEANLETGQLRQELEQCYNKIKNLQLEVSQQQQSFENKIKELQYVPQLQEISEAGEGNDLNPDLKTLEVRYNELLNEKWALEHQMRDVQQQMEDQSSILVSFKEKLDEMSNQKKQLEVSFQEKDQALASRQQYMAALESRVHQLEETLQDKIQLHEKYEQLREEFVQISDQLEEALGARMMGEHQLEELSQQVKVQAVILSDQGNLVAQLMQEKEHLQTDIHQLHIVLEENEDRFKIAQQHLAKKVKESTILTEKLEEQQFSLEEQSRQLERLQAQIHQSQTSIELYQNQEKKLQEKLNETLRSTESQVIKWEEKYFKMYDKWQESETQIRELKKFEEKHNQMQNLIANLGSFVGNSHPPASFLESAQETPEKSAHFHYSTDLQENQIGHKSQVDEGYDLFEIKPPPADKLKLNLFS